MKNFNLLTTAYLFCVLTVGGALTVWLISGLDGQQWQLLLALCVLAALLQTLKIEGTTFRTSYNLSWVVYGFALFSMGPSEAMLVILVAHLAEWVRHRYTWYIQTFNIASFGIAVGLAGFAYAFISPSSEPLSMAGSLAILVAASLFTFSNHLLVGLIIKLARGQSLADSGVLSAISLSLDAGMLCLGASGALIWLVNPYAVVLVALLALLLQNVLKVPALRRQSETDPKVGLFNARYFSNTVDQELERANRFNRPLTLIMADIDLLRRVNNSYGHLAGDIVLQGVAQILGEVARDFDTVSRFGGEEFAILMPETTPDEAYAIVEAMRGSIEEAEFTVATSVSPIKITMSFGIAERFEEDMTSQELIHQADLALYEAKQKGRNRTCTFGQSLSVVAAEPPGPIAPEMATVAPEPDSEETPVSNGATVYQASEVAPPLKPALAEQTQPSSSPGKYQIWRIRVYVGSVTLTAILLAALLIRPNLDQDWLGLAAFTVVVLLVEALAVSIYVKETSVSTSAALLLAGVLLFGPLAAVFLGLAVAAAAYIRERSQLDRLLFNGSNHVIGGLLASGLVVASGRTFEEWNVAAQIAISLAAMALIYLSTTALVSGAVSLDHHQPFQAVWNERFRWLAPYYLALGVVAYALVFSFFTAGLLGIIVVLIPLLMLRFSQKQYIDHTKNVVDKLRRTNVRLSQQAEEISLLNEELLVALARATDMRDPYVMEHSLNVARYAESIAKELGLPAERVELVRKAGLLHDIGKLSIPESILFKAGRLTDEEYSIVKEHAAAGADLIFGCHSLRPLIPFIKHHHEWYDGSGYPDGLAGDEIPLEARILGASDALEAMASDRPYRKGRTPQGIVEEMNKWGGRQFDPQIVNAINRIVAQQGDSVIVNSARSVQARQVQNNSPKTAVESSSSQGEDFSAFRPALAS